MQPYFLCCCVFQLCFLEVVVKLFDYFWKPNSLFSKFCVNCLLIFYFVYCDSCALKDVNGACQCTYSLVALGVPEMCFWPAKTRKKLELFEMHTCHWPGAQIWLRHKWKKLVTACFLVDCVDWYSCLRYWNEFFAAVFQVLDWSFLVLHSDETSAFGFQKCFDHEWIDFGVFCWEMASVVDFISVWTETCKNCSTFSFLTSSIFFQFLIWGLFWSVL